MAKPSPSLPLSLSFKVLIPTTLPSISTSGPPLFPGFSAASVWMYTMGSSEPSCRATELTTPILTELRSPSGLPIAKTNSPWRTRRSLRKRTAGKCVASILSSARSDCLCVPKSLASTICPAWMGWRPEGESAKEAGKITRMRCAPSTTWALVMM